jgi:3-ketosteroid 9alpha-monooxygenase subunit A
VPECLPYVLCATPITPYLSDLRATAYIPMVRGDGTQLDDVLRNRWMTQQNLQVDADIRIWRHQSYLHRPALDAMERAPLRELRRWASNLYDD